MKRDGGQKVVLSTQPSRRLGAELALFATVGVVMALLGPYETYRLPTTLRLGYWIACMVGGGMIGVLVDAVLARSIGDIRRRVPASAVAMTLPVACFVFVIGLAFGVQPLTRVAFLWLLWQVFVVSLPVMAVRALTWRQPRTVIETRTVVAPPLPEAEAAFRQRLSAPRRSARLIALEAEDHYLRVHTDAGEELLTMRFGDALEELSRAHGHRIHRSWWVSADAIDAVKWRRGGGEARLAGDLVAPVSRSYAAALRSAGWT